MIRVYGVPVAVYEAEPALTARNQGGTLDMHADSGQIALRGAGLFDAFLALSRPEGQSKRILNPQGQVVSDQQAADDEDGAPEMDWGQLRAPLVDSLTPGTVCWNHALVSATPEGDGQHTLLFADGERTVTDLVIGADGTWSRVRPLVSDAQPLYSGVTLVEAWFNDADLRHPEVARIVRNGHASVRGEGKSLIGQRNSALHLRVYIGMRTAVDWFERAGVTLADTGAVRRALLEVFSGWDSSVLRMISDNDGPYVNRPIFELPAPLTWPHTPGVTLLGDAAHVMSPFGGKGANLPLLDGCDLALALVKADSIDAAISAYERVMLPREGENAIRSNRALSRFFADGPFGLQTDVPNFAEERAQYKSRAAAYS